jgi:uncharacterized membrane protein (DUF4010 family)
VDITVSIKALAEALLIGTLIGAEREKFPGNHPGLRDFLAIALIGGVCGLLGIPWLGGVALAAIALLLALFQYEHRKDESRGITTELAGVATFCLAYVVSSPTAQPFGPPIAIGASIVVVLFLEARDLLHRIARETITVVEFNNTLLFVAIALVIYPLLPPGRFGPHQFFSPQQVWLFVVLVSSISYLGYFFRKFLGTERGLELTSVVGGLASTSAATLSFARLSREHPNEVDSYWRACVIANTVQFPRTLAILLAVSTPMAMACLPSLAAMFAVSALLALYLKTRRLRGSANPPQPFTPGNPFRLVPGIVFGGLFAFILYISKVAAADLGPQALLATSVLGGLVDVATVILSGSELLATGHISRVDAAQQVLLALGANIVLKLILSTLSGTRPFAWRMAGWAGLVLVSGWIAAIATLR